MVQNRNKLIELFISNISNYIIHKVLENAIDDESISNRYGKESINSFNIAKRYREKINPANKYFLDKDVGYIRDKIIRKTKAELMIRISKSYKNINIYLIESFVDEVLSKLLVSS